MIPLESIFKRRKSIRSSRHRLLPSPDLCARAPAALPTTLSLPSFPERAVSFSTPPTKPQGKHTSFLGNVWVQTLTQVSGVEVLDLQGQSMLEKPTRTPVNAQPQPGASEITVKGGPILCWVCLASHTLFTKLEGTPGTSPRIGLSTCIRWAGEETCSEKQSNVQGHTAQMWQNLDANQAFCSSTRGWP